MLCLKIGFFSLVRDHEKIMKCMLRLSICLLFKNIKSLYNSLNEVLLLVLRRVCLVLFAFVFFEFSFVCIL